MFLHYFQINTNCLYVCLAVCQLAYFHSEIRNIQGNLLIWMRNLPDFFLRHSSDVCTPFSNDYKFLICLSVCQFAYFLTEIRPIQGYLLSQMRYLSEVFWRHYWDVFTLSPNLYKLFVFLSVCQLAHFLTEIRQMQGYLLFWMSYLSENFWRHSQDVFTQFQNDYKFFVCLSACQLAHFLTEIRQKQVYLLFWMKYLPENFWRHSQDVFTLFPNNCKLFACLSVCQLAHFLTEIRLMWGYLQFWRRYLSEFF